MTEKSCCSTASGGEKKGFWSGLVYGLIPHTFCIVFIVFSIIGATTATIFFKKLLILPYFFQILIGFSFFFATLSAAFYLKRLNCLSLVGLKRKWHYLLTLYGVTMLVNLLFFMVIFPVMANFNQPITKEAEKLAQSNGNYLSLGTLRVDIPCPGHATLIMSELQKSAGIITVNFKFPNLFEVTYDQNTITREKILNQEIFKKFKASFL